MGFPLDARLFPVHWEDKEGSLMTLLLSLEEQCPDWGPKGHDVCRLQVFLGGQDRGNAAANHMIAHTPSAVEH